MGKSLGAPVIDPHSSLYRRTVRSPPGRPPALPKAVNFHELRRAVSWRPDVEALRSSPARLVIGIGEDSAGELCDRSSRALAAELGLAPTMFPGGHTAMGDDPEGFAVRLRAALS